MFPFLIGRIRTIFWSSNGPDMEKFPFLIGRIRTVKSKSSRLLQPFRFPFLIGRIRTKKEE